MVGLKRKMLWLIRVKMRGAVLVNKSFLIMTYFFVVMISVVIVWGSFKMVRNERFIKYENAASSKREFMKKHEKKFDLFAKIIFIVGAILLVTTFVIPGLLDLPNVISNTYPTVEGKAVTSAGVSNTSKPKIVTIESENGKSVRLRFYSANSIHKGDYLKVVYLPHLKRGILLMHKIS